MSVLQLLKPPYDQSVARLAEAMRQAPMLLAAGDSLLPLAIALLLSLCRALLRRGATIRWQVDNSVGRAVQETTGIRA